MAQPGGSFQIRSDADTAASESLARLSDGRRADNIAAACVVRELHHLFEIRLGEEMDIHLLGADRGDDEPDVSRARRATECEAAVALSVSRTVSREMITVANQLAWRLPAVDAAFAAGDLDYSRVRAIGLTLRRASDGTVSALEAEVLAVALRCNLRSLRENIWKLWIAHNPDEAAAAQKAAVSEERCADIRRGDDGIATLVAKMSILEGAECNSLLDEYSETVCTRDPRTKKQLRGHALLALFHREDSLTCLCNRDDCPFAGAGAAKRPRRGALLNVHVDLETLLGLTGSPATLADGTILDPETARLLATDARWQMFLTEMVDAARSHQGIDESQDSEDATGSRDGEHSADSGDYADDSGDGDRGGSAEDGNTKNGAGNSTGADSGNDVDGKLDPLSESTAGETKGTRFVSRRRGVPSIPRARRILRRGRQRPAAPLPAGDTRSRNSDQPTWSLTNGAEAALSKAISEFLQAAAANPALGEGLHPDGHGGHSVPPKGALTYRPSAELVALVRATYCTCTFPGCSAPAASCDIDHIVPFDHDDPQRGGWTIRDNLHPLCSYHHQAKTLRLWACAKLDGDGIYWRSAAGLHRITPPTFGTVIVPEEFVHSRVHRPGRSPDNLEKPGAAVKAGAA
ncbi:MAG: DUF222 domain-containing protein, partial [Rhodococcus sp. (in: high G+C Gram-positive bacteria)]